jgi:predicted ester cyclase
MEEITLQSKGDISKIMSPGTERKQSLKGFDDDYVDIVDYIVRCTHKIWEGHGIGLIYTHYGHNVSVWTTDGLTYGREAVIENTLRAQAAFPDCRLYADEVIWTGNDEDGFHTSHRITWVAHNTGYSIYGPPTGRKVIRTGIANCLVKENRIIEEWIARDELGLVKQLGFDVHEVVTKLVKQDAARNLKPPPPLHPPQSWGGKRGGGEIERVIGQTTPEVMPPKETEGFDIEDFVRRSFHEVWNWRLLNKIDDYYVRNYACHTTCSRNLYGLGAFKAFVLTLLGSFPDAMITIDHLYWMGNEQDGYRTMTRWSLQGTHKGPGPYGDPMGKPFYLMGISHHTVKDSKFVEEWTYFDEVALLKQLWQE